MTIAFHNDQLNAFNVDPEDDVFLRPEENTFLFFVPGNTKLQLLFGKRENYQKGTIDFKDLILVTTDLLGQRCLHCKEQVQDVSNLCAHLQKGRVKTLMHETCFASWFVNQNKSSLTPYRFVRSRKRKLTAEGSSFQVKAGNAPPVAELSFNGLRSISFEEIKTGDGTESRDSTSSAPGIGFSGTPPQGMTQEDFYRNMMTGGDGRPVQSAAPAPAPSPAAPPVRTKIQVSCTCPHCARPFVLDIEPHS